jgi:hypothetical protein
VNPFILCRTDSSWAAAEKKAPIACPKTGDGGLSLSRRICGDILTAEPAWQEAKLKAVANGRILTLPP